MTEVILVNAEDNEIGYCEKYKAHREGLLHRAFSIFLFNNNLELILQKRASTKYHSPNLWSNTCCSHQVVGETLEGISQKRLKEEMGIECALEKAFETMYRFDCRQGMIEHEYNHILIGFTECTPIVNKEEASTFKIDSLNAVEGQIEQNPHHFTEWFKFLLPQVKSKLLVHEERRVHRILGNANSLHDISKT